VNVHRLRQAGCNDQAILDLLQLQQLALVPGVLQTKALQELWSCSQPMVSRRMAAVHSLGVVYVRSRWGGYTVCDQVVARKPVICKRNVHDPSAAAKRWEAMRQKWLKAV
jgi:hypothetical protein